MTIHFFSGFDIWPESPVDRRKRRRELVYAGRLKQLEGAQTPKARRTALFKLRRARLFRRSWSG